MQTAPLFDAIAAGPAGGAAHWVNTSDGLRIRVGHWTHPDAKGTVIIFPGRTEFVEKYGRTAQAFHDRGFASAAIDWRGQGIADRMTDNRAIGHVGSFHDYQYDVKAVTDHLDALNMPKPYFMVAHSMGGCIGLRALIEGMDVKAAMFSAPMWGIQISPLLWPVAWGLSSISRPLGFDQSLAPGQFEKTYVLRTEFAQNILTKDADMFAAMQTQVADQPDLALGGPSLRWLNTSLREMYRLSQESSPDVPCITYLGSEEAIVDPTRIHARMESWENGALRVIDGGKHEMLMDRPDLRNAMFDAAADLFTQNQ